MSCSTASLSINKALCSKERSTPLHGRDTNHIRTRQRAIWQGALMGAYSKGKGSTPSDHELLVALLDTVCRGLDVSHRCGNLVCSDPSHVHPDSHAMNQHREDCLDPRRRKHNRPCPHHPPCLPELKWPSVEEQWQQVRSNSLGEVVTLPRPSWMCSVGGTKSHIKAVINLHEH